MSRIRTAQLRSENLRSEQNKYNQTRNFLDILKTKSEKAIETFFEILRTRSDAQYQPHIYHHMFSEQQDGPWQQDDATSVAYTSTSLQQRELPKMGSQWGERNACLQPTLLLDHLRLIGLLTAEEHKQLQQRSLTGKGAVADHCEGRPHVEGQRHLY